MHKKALLFGLLSGLLFGMATPISKLLLDSLNSYTVAGLLYLGAAVVFLPTILKNRQRDINLPLIRQNWLKLVGIILFGGILGPLFLLAGLTTANASSVSIWLNFELIATVMLGVLFFKEHLSKYGALGVLFTLISGIIISFNETVASLQAGIFIILACVSWGIDNHLTAITDEISSTVTTFIKGLVGGTVNLTLGFLIFEQTDLFQLNALATVLLGMFSYGISIVLYISTSQLIGATRGQILFSISPFWGVVGAAVLLAEPITLQTIFAFVALTIGIIFSNIRGHDHAHHHAKVEHIHLHNHLDNHHLHEHVGLDKHVMHIHLHTHDELTHDHDHFPDLHHRHTHSHS